MLTLSRYAVGGQRATGDAVYVSTRIQRRVHVTAAQHQALQQARAHDGVLPTAPALDDLVLDRLASAGILVSAERDETAELLAAHHRDREDRTELTLTVAPTIACNLACTYCFEPSHRAETMTPEDELRLLRFVRRELPGRRVLRVVWFGGEPLLQPATIVRLSAALLRMASFAGVAFVGDLITNGTQLTPELARQLRAVRVLSTQITIDGPARIHDRLRPTRGGRASYDDTVAGALAAHQHLAVYLRVNLGRHNLEAVPELLTDLVARGLGGAQIGFTRVEPPAVYGTGPDATDPDAVDPSFLTVAEFAEAEAALLAAARQAGLRAEVPGYRADDAAADDDALPCVALDRSHFAIEPGGQVKRCWAEITDERFLTGQLDADGRALPTVRDAAWAQAEPIDAECAACPVLPLCFGGCPKARLDGAMGPAASAEQRRAFKHRYVCTPRRFNLPALLAAELIT